MYSRQVESATNALDFLRPSRKQFKKCTQRRRNKIAQSPRSKILRVCDIALKKARDVELRAVAALDEHRKERRY